MIICGYFSGGNSSISRFHEENFTICKAKVHFLEFTITTREIFTVAFLGKIKNFVNFAKGMCEMSKCRMVLIRNTFLKIHDQPVTVS